MASDFDAPAVAATREHPVPRQAQGNRQSNQVAVPREVLEAKLKHPYPKIPL